METALDSARSGRRTAGSAMESLATRRELTRAGVKAPVHVKGGDRVTHEKFGLGTVVSVEGEGDKAMARVDFGETEGVKRLLLRYAPVVKL